MTRGSLSPRSAGFHLSQLSPRIFNPAFTLVNFWPRLFSAPSRGLDMSLPEFTNVLELIPPQAHLLPLPMPGVSLALALR